MKILPVYPEYPTSFWSLKYAVKMLGKKATMPPLGLATVLSMLPQDKFDIQRVVDLNVTRLRDSEIQNCDMVFTSSMLVQNKSLDDIIDRAHSFGKRIVAGGPYPTSYTTRVHADHLVLGEAEVTLPPFLEDLLNENPRRIYDVKSVRDRVKINLNKELRPNLDATPIPRLDLLDLSKYASLAIQYSRGCPFDCEFCDITHLYGTESRTKTTDQMIKELDAAYKAGWRASVFIVDDNFIGNKKNVRELLPAITQWQKEHNYPFTFYTEASMDLALPGNREILEGMVGAGFDSVFLGIESVDPEVLKNMNKMQNISRTQTPYDKVRIIQEAGLKVFGGFIVGNDGEKPEVFENLFQFIQQSGIVTAMPGLLGALKGTKLYNRLEQEGRLRADSTGDNTHGLEFNFQPEMDEAFLIEGYKELLVKLFDPENYYERCRVLDSRIGEHKVESRLNIPGLRALACVMYENLIRHPDFEFVKYISETIHKNPRKFSEAIANAVRFHHFRTITDATASISDYKESVGQLYENLLDKVKDLSGSVEERYRQFSKMQRRVEREAVRLYGRINKDFRDNATAYLENFRGKISNLRASYLTN